MAHARVAGPIGIRLQAEGARRAVQDHEPSFETTEDRAARAAPDRAPPGRVLDDALSGL